MYVAKKANSTLAFIRRNLKSCQRQIKADAYSLYVKPILEYAAVVWAPHTRCDIDKLETVQRRAARFVMSDYNRTSSVTAMLHNLNWNTLYSRRRTSRLFFLYFYFFYPGLDGTPLPPPPAQKSRVLDNCLELCI